MNLLDRVNNCKTILKDFENNCVQLHTKERFDDLDDQIEYLENKLKQLVLQIENFDINENITKTTIFACYK
jgi:hypothetical protein